MSLKTPIPPEISYILSTLTQAGHPAYLVGGCVRDAIMGRVPGDWDLCTAALPHETMALFDHTVPTGLKHGTVTVLYGGLMAEVTTFRRESTYSDHRRPDAVDFTDSLHEDLARRDFTMNAIAMDAHGNLQDPFDGKADLSAKLIRCVGDPDLRFQEDALRMFRGVRFAAQLGFEIHPWTFSAIEKNASLSRFVAPERIHIELEKTLLSPHPEFLDVMIRLGLLDGFLSAGEEPDWDGLSALPPERSLRYARLCKILLDAGRISTPAGFLKSLRLDSHTIRVCDRGVSIASHSFPGTAPDIKGLLAQYGPEAVRCAAACGNHTVNLPQVDTVLESGECFDLEHLAIHGDALKTLGFTGREIDAMLQALLEYVICHPEENNTDTLLEFIRKETSAHG